VGGTFLAAAAEVVAGHVAGEPDREDTGEDEHEQAPARFRREGSDAWSPAWFGVLELEAEETVLLELTENVVVVRETCSVGVRRWA